MKELFKGKYRIKSIRLPTWDYSSNGYYFVTICTNKRIEYFGEIRNGIMGLNESGCIAAKYWQEIPMHFENVELDEWVVMPNHVHGIIIIDKPNDVGTDRTNQFAHVKSTDHKKISNLPGNPDFTIV